MKLLVVTSGRTTPSARFRHRQYYGLLARDGFEIQDVCPPVNNGARLPGPLGHIRMRYLAPVAIGQVVLNLLLRLPAVAAQYRNDLTWLERTFVPGADWLGVLLRRPYVLDLDDAVWLYNPGGARMTGLLARRARGIIAGNQVIAQWCRAHNDNVVVIPTAIDCDRFRPEAANGLSRPFTVGWTGIAVNFKHLKLIEGALGAFFAAHPEARLRIVADRAPVLTDIADAQLEFIPWSPDVEASAVAGMDIGLMPLVDDAVARAKCSFKMLQYMACGRPVIVSPVGLNAEILAMGQVGYGIERADDWRAALERLAAEPELRSRLGAEGRRVALTQFDTPIVADRIAEFLRACTR